MTTPHLRWIDRRGQEQIHGLNSDEVVMGRRADAHLVLDSEHVSRRHAKIVKTDRGHILVDLGSAHGTFVNGQPVNQQVLLQHGDKINLGKVGVTLFYFTEPSEAPLPKPGDLTTKLEQSFADLTMELSGERSELEKISCVLDFQYHWGQMFTPEMAFQQILKSALKISAAERGFILRKQPIGFAYAAGIDGQDQLIPQSDFQTSHSVVEQVLAEGKPVFMTEAIQGKFVGQASIMAMKLRAIACLPLQGIPLQGATPEILGILYLDSTQSMHSLSGLDQRILSKLAVEASNVLEKVEMIKNVEQRKKLEEELALAEDTQKGLLPQSLPQVENLRLRAFSKPTRYVGGDFYHLTRLNTGELIGVLGDVTGKGIPAALMSSMLLGCLEMQLRSGAEPQEALTRLNQFLCEKTTSNRFVTLFLFTLNPEGQGQFISAGHPAAYLFRSAKREIEELSSNSLLLGAFGSATYQATPLQLDPGDVLLVYSDGLTDAENPGGEMLGEERVRTLVKSASLLGAEQLEQQLLATIHDFTQEKPQTDDITIVIVEKTK